MVHRYLCQLSCRSGIALCAVVYCSVAARAAELAPAATANDIDAAASVAFEGSKALGAAPAGALEQLLGIAKANGPLPEWTTGPQLSKVLHFRVAFKQPIQLGTIVTTYSGGRQPGKPLPRVGTSVSYLKAEAPYPGDVANDDQWVVLAPGEVKTLPTGTRTRALRFTDRQGEWGYAAGGDRFTAKMPPALLYRARYYDAVATGYAKTSGSGRDEKQPKVWFGYWSETAPLAALVLLPQNKPAKIEALRPDVTEHPILVTGADWKSLDALPASQRPLVRAFEPPLMTRALRITGGNLQTVLPLLPLKDGQDLPVTQETPPPFNFKYDMPMDGFVAINIIDKKTGRRVRRLVAEVERDKGVVTEPWDLKDENGSYVPPGDYAMKAIARPPFKLTYQLTPYNAGQPPWWAPAPGKGGGGWMADHTPPFAAVTLGDRVYFGSQYNESGDGLIAVDHQGNKLWGQAYIYGFECVQRLAADDRFVYVYNNMMVQRFDSKGQVEPGTLLNFKYTRALPGNQWRPDHGGIAVRGDKMYLGVSGPAVSWLQTPFAPDLLDPSNSFPVARLSKGNGGRGLYDKIYRDEEYDELMRFYAAFLTDAMPEQTRSLAGVTLPSSTQAYFGDAATTGALADNLIAVFKQPITVGSVLVPSAKAAVYALKPGANLPSADPNPDAAPGDDGGLDEGKLNEDDWIRLPTGTKGDVPGLAVAPAGGLKTRALRFVAKRLQFAQILNRRFEDIAPQAERVVSDGQATPAGGWSLTRPASRPVNQFNQPRMALVWPQAVTLRGVSLVRPNAGIMEVDSFIGPAGADPKTALNDDKQWRKVGGFAPIIFNGFFPQTPTLRNVDFGELLQTRALRIRALAPPNHRKADVGGPWPAATDVLGGVVAHHYLGDDPAGLPVELSQRIEEYQLPPASASADTPAKLLRQIPFREPGNLLFGKDGTLYAQSAGRVVTVPLDGNGAPREVIAAGQVAQPAAMAFDAGEQLYISDLSTQQVKVFDAKTGKLVRTIGKPGGHKPGPWDPEYMDRPTGLTIDSAGKLWVAHNSYQPKRISRWSADGKYEASFLGPTQYGGGGTLDEGDRSVINYNGMKFTVDWAKMDWKLASILYRPGPGMSVDAAMPDRAVYCKGKRYLVGSGEVSVVCAEKGGIAVPFAAAGNLGAWDEVARRPELLEAFGALDRQSYGFCWTDANGDGVPQPGEVQTTQKNALRKGFVGDDLAINFDGARLRPAGFSAVGAPLYDIEKLELLPLMSSRGWSTPDGKTFTMVDQWDRMLDVDGKTILWDYFDQYAVHDGFYASGYGYDRPAGVLNAEQWTFGHIKKLGNEDYFITSSDQGDWFVFTGDGMLVGCIFGGPTGYGLRRWTMPDWTPGKVNLDDVRLLQECYQGNVVKADDGNVYAVAGKNHMSIVKVEGLEKLQRLAGGFAVTSADLEKAHAWSVQMAAQAQARQQASIARVAYIANGMAVNGSLDDWPDELFFTVHEYDQKGLHHSKHVLAAQAALAYDDKNLYVAARVLDNSPLVNTAENPQLIFKQGDALDIQLALDPAADARRTNPAPGDVRLLVTRRKGEPLAMLYRYKVPGSDPAKRVHFTSPVGETWVDEVLPVAGAQIGVRADGEGWELEVAIPWQALGTTAPRIGARLRGDVGVLQSDQNGVQTVNRLYWAGKSQKVVSDLPSEARISPALWGEFFFAEADRDMKFGPEDGGLVGGP